MGEYEKQQEYKELNKKRSDEEYAKQQEYKKQKDKRDDEEYAKEQEYKKQNDKRGPAITKRDDEEYAKQQEYKKQNDKRGKEMTDEEYSKLQEFKQLNKKRRVLAGVSVSLGPTQLGTKMGTITTSTDFLLNQRILHKKSCLWFLKYIFDK